VADDLADWTWEIKETSNLVWRVTGRDSLGRSVERTGNDVDTLMVECREVARRLAKDRPSWWPPPDDAKP
jgi:hypothetical protein